eukprot:GFUD01033036.1.p1 GENE.GFUD01033036.1~~GFUD01033036.1.p1  ORF type:complete len:325 (-),score=80.48 GFUD01033036.1:89-1063(-)
MATTKLFLPPLRHSALPSCRRHFWSRKPPPRPPADKTYSVVKPGSVSPRLKPSELPQHVRPPPYYLTGVPPQSPNYHEVKTAESIQCMREACSLARRVLTEASKLAKVGNTTDLIDELVTQLSFEAGAYPSPLNYRNFPKSVCTSVNNCVCHGIPDSRPLEDGDIINIDITVFLNGHHGDCSETFLVGEVDMAGQELVKVAREALYVGIDQCGPGKLFNGIGAAIQSFVNSQGLRVIPSFTGHGIGTYFHGPPDIYPCRNSYPGRMKPGMTFTVEPAVSEGSPEVAILSDGWTAVSPDDSRSAQFEHTVLITEEGVEILTLHTD